MSRQTNEGYTPKIEFNKDAKNQILFHLSKLIKIEGKRDVSKSKDKIYEAPSIFKSRINREQMSKTEKIEKCYTPEKSTTYCVSSLKEGTAGFNNNSPYQQRLAVAVTPERSSPLARNGTHDSYRSQNYNLREYDTRSRKMASYRRENEYVYQPIV
jgi:hypothetical protein